MFKEIYNNLKKNDINLETKKIIIGFSGGSDSMILILFLLYCRKNYNLILKAVHMNHNERNTASDEENFVKKFCDKHKIELSLYSDKTLLSNTKKEKGFEMAGREARRMVFLKEQKIFNADYIFTGHNLNDAIETMFINIERGTGIRGISSNKLVNGSFVKPLINIEKRRILEYLNKKRVPFIFDETNMDERFTRNRIRHNILPVLERSLNGGLLRFDRFFENVNSVISLFDFIIANEIKTIKNKNTLIIDISKILYYNTKIRKNLLYYILSRELYVDSSMIDSIESMISSKKPNIIIKTKNMFIEKSYNEIKIYKLEFAKTSEEVLLLFDIFSKFNGYIIKLKKEVFEKEMLREKDLFVFPLAAGKIFKVRVLGNSDEFIPFGMNRKKKVSRFLMDNKVGFSERRRIPLLINEKNEILAVGSLRRTNLYKMNKQKGCICYYVRKS